MTGDPRPTEGLAARRSDGSRGRFEGLPLGLAILAALVPLAGTLVNGLLWDDVYFVDPATGVDDIGRLPSALVVPFWDGSSYLALRLTDFWRPLTTAAIRLTGALAGTTPLAFHILSVLAALAAGAALYRLVRLVAPRGDSRTAAWVAVLFVAHPLCIEVALMAVNAADHLAFAFLALQVGFLIRWYREGRGAGLLLLAAGAGLAACAGKELGVLAAGAPIAAFAFLRAGGRPLPVRVLTRAGPWLASIAPVTIYLAARIAVISAAGRDPLSLGRSDFSFEVVVLGAGQLLRAAFVPAGHGLFLSVPPGDGIGWGAATAAWIGLFLAVALEARRRRRPGFVSTGVVLALALAIPSLLAVDFSEEAWRFPVRYYHLPLAGLLIAALPAIDGLVRRRLQLALGAAVVLLALAGWVRAGEGRDNAALFEAEAGHHPQSLFALVNLAEFQCEARRFDAARRTLDLIDSHPLSTSAEAGSMAHTTRAKIAMLERGDAEEATRHLEQALVLVPEDLVNVLLLAEARARAGHPEQAVRVLEKALVAPWFRDQRARTIESHLRRYQGQAARVTPGAAAER